MLMSWKRKDANLEQWDEQKKAKSKLLVPFSYALALIIADAQHAVKPKHRLLPSAHFKCRILKCCSN